MVLASYLVNLYDEDLSSNMESDTEVRKFSSTAAVQSGLVKAPIQLFGIEGRYAHALYSAASKEKKLVAVESELQEFKKLIVSDQNFAEYVNNPTIKRKDKSDAIKQILTSQKMSTVSINFFAALADNGRFNRLTSVIGAFEKLMSANRGEVLCTVTTAKALDATSLKELKNTLQTFVKKGETIHLETKVDASLIGGMIVNIGDKYVDMSMASKIKAYTNLIKEAV